MTPKQPIATRDTLCSIPRRNRSAHRPPLLMRGGSGRRLHVNALAALGALAAASFATAVPLATGVASVAGAGACAAVAAAAAAQPAPLSPRRDRNRLGYAGSFTEAEFGVMTERLGLDAEQVELARAIFDGFRSGVSDIRDETDAAWDAMQAKFAQDQPRDEGRQFVVDFDMIERISVAQDEARARIDTLFADFETDMQSILSAEQAELWPTYVREFRRRVGLRQLPGRGAASVNLVTITEAMALDPNTRTRLDPTLDAYVTELDEGINAWQQVTEEMTESGVARPIRPSGDGQELSPADQQAIADITARATRASAARLRLADINVRYAETLAGQMPYEAAEAFRDAFHLRAFGDIFGPTAADRYIDSARELADLTEAQVAGLDAIESDFEAQVAPINLRILEARRKHDRERLKDLEEQERESLRAAAGGGGGGGAGGNARGGVPDRPRGGGEGDVVVVQTITMTMAPPTDEGEGGGGGRASVLTGETSGPAEVSIGPARPMLFNAAPQVEMLNSGDRSKAERDLLMDKHQLIVRTIENVFALLTPDQQALLPKPTVRPPISMPEAMAQAMRGEGTTLPDGRREIQFENGRIVFGAGGEMSIEMDGIELNFGESGIGGGTASFEFRTGGLSPDPDAPDR